ncbi:MAG: sugar isomerase, partial [Clostridiaceae bacterium]|nr:sugar isomerase [Clostridiaceae bacterium]
MTTVLDCIERIPKSLKGIRDSYPERTKNIADYLSGRGIKKVGRLVFIASGSSYNSAHTAKLFIKNQCGIETEFKYPNIFVHYEADTELSREAKDLDSTVYV